MKKKLLFSILCLGLLLPIGANADDSTNIDSIEEGNNSTNVDATVSNVAVPTYEVAIIWDDLSFDWSYNKDTKSFEWKPTSMCRPAGITNQKEYSEINNEYNGEIYTDESCSILNEEEYSEDKNYYVIYERENAYIGIEDMSQNGEIVPSIIWESESKYSDTEAEIKYRAKECLTINSENVFDGALEHEEILYSDENCTTEVTNTPEYETGKYYVYAEKMDSKFTLETEELPENARFSAESACVDDICFYSKYDENNYYLSLNLVGGTVTPTVGDKIGSVTIKIKAAK